MNQDQEQQILKIAETYFHRGAFVKWLDPDDKEGIRLRFGLVECERSDSPGHFYVRAEDGMLYDVLWSDLKLASR